MSSGVVGRLSSTYDPTASSITVEVRVDETMAAGWSLAFTSIVQIEPGVDARLVEQLASFHRVEPAEAGPLNGAWTFVSAEIGHRPRHANDGPLSAYLVDAHGATHRLAVTPMHRVGGTVPPAADAPEAMTTAPEIPIVPHPVHVAVEDATAGGSRVADLGSAPTPAAAAWRTVTELATRLTGRSVLGVAGGVVVDAVDDPGVVDEGYEMAVDGDAVVVRAAGVAGFRHAFVTLARWLPHGLPHRATIQDAPEFTWRGLHLDLARQWFEPDVVERVIDEAAWLKMSRLHLHLTDDEAWRLPVDGYQRIAEVGATRGHGLELPPMLGGGPDPSGRAYSEPEITRWVERADELGVVLVPEIDVPAHAHAALTAIPELREPGDTSGARSVQFFTDNVLVPGRAETDRFVEAAFTTAARLFPSSPWIHLGGDEVPDGAWSGSPSIRARAGGDAPTSVRDVEALFHRSVVELVRGRLGRSVGAWQEAAESGGVTPGDGYAIGWRTIDANRELARQGYDVVVSPGQAYYLDMAVDTDWATPGASWAGHTSLEDVVEFDPADGWSPGERERLLGVQACLWTEYVPDESALRDRLFPRLDAIAERAWTGRVVGHAASLRRRAHRS